MKKQQGIALSKSDADSLIRAIATGEKRADDPLARLLAATIPPATPPQHELAGETAAVAAFRAAAANPTPTKDKRSMITAALAKLATVKVAAVVLGVSAAGGVALAASTDTIDVPVVGDDKPTTAATPTDDIKEKAAKTTDGVEDTTQQVQAVLNDIGPNPSLAGLCNAYAAGAVSDPAKTLQNPAFGTLIDAAGGVEKVTDYCLTLADPANNADPGQATDAAEDVTNQVTGEAKKALEKAPKPELPVDVPVKPELPDVASGVVPE